MLEAAAAGRRPDFKALSLKLFTKAQVFHGAGGAGGFRLVEATIEISKLKI